MIISRAPMRISFVGGGTDIAEFYTRYPGRVLSTSIDKYIYVISHSGYSDKIILKYSKTEIVKNLDEIEHGRFKESLRKMGIDKSIEIASFADLPSNTGLGSSSSFAVALMKNLYAAKGEKKSKEETARAACELEIDILKEPIGKQDQYAAAYGGLNMIQFNQDGTVDVEPIFIDYEFKSRFEEHLLLFFTGMTRSASTVLSVQKKSMNEKFETYKEMSDSVLLFKEKLLAKDIKGMADMLHDGWMKKKSLSSSVATSSIDELYDAGRKAGAWGGKLLGAGGGGCLLFIAPPENHAAIRASLEGKAKELGLQDFKDIHFSLTQGGVDVLFNTTNNISYV
jgi:D-glycero-alpha-D-manno-heptose-7-phosphate kinase